MNRSRRSARPGTNRPRGRAAAGFTLIEVLIAFAIAAFGLAALFQGAGTGLTGVALGAKYVEATRRAQSHLAEIGIVAPLVPGDRSGDDGAGFAWRVHVAPLGRRVATQSGPPPPNLYAVDVGVSWRSSGSGREVILSTLRLGPPTPGPS